MPRASVMADARRRKQHWARQWAQATALVKKRFIAFVFSNFGFIASTFG
jgi:hypothetical protein